MAIRPRYVQNTPGLGKIMKGAGMQAMLAAEARKGQGYAEASSPVETGDYISSFGVSSVRRGAGRWSDRAAAYLYNTSDHAAAVEFQDGYRVLGRTVDAIERGL